MEVETPEVKVPQGQQSTFTSTADVMDKFAANLSQKKEQAKQEVEVKAEVVAEPKAEAPKEPTANGQSENPKKELEIVTPEIKENEDAWRKELGFDDTAEIKTEEIKKDDNSKLLKEYERKAKEYEEDSNDTFISAYKASKKAGKDVSSFINEVRGVDVNSLTPEQIWDANLKAEGLSPEDITTEMEKFAELSPFEKKQKTKTFKQELITQQHEQLKKYASDNVNSAQDKQALAVMAQEQGKKFFEKIKDKEWQGMKMTPSEVNKLENFLEKEFQFINADGTLNYELYAKVGNYALNERTILQNTYKKGETKGYEKAFLEIARPSNNDKRFNSAPDVKTANKSEQAKKAAKEVFNPA
jgi:hypothetical protein